jgi:excinuclease UvrABC ATPase subunit
MDEPTIGLHISDIGHLMQVVIEHNLHIIKNADWIIDMGPEGGSKGGEVIFEDTPRQRLSAKRSIISEYLQN